MVKPMNDETNVKSDGISLDEIIEVSREFQKSRIFLTACEMDVFTVLGDEEKSSKEISDAINANHRGTDRLLNALCALRVLKKSGDKYKNSPNAAQYLVKGKSDYQAGLTSLELMGYADRCGSKRRIGSAKTGGGKR